MTNPNHNKQHGAVESGVNVNVKQIIFWKKQQKLDNKRGEPYGFSLLRLKDVLEGLFHYSWQVCGGFFKNTINAAVLL